MIGNNAVFLTSQALEELNGIADHWIKESDRGKYFLCKVADTDGVFTLLEFEDNVTPGNMHLKIPHHYVKAILFGESLKSVGFIQEDAL